MKQNFEENSEIFKLPDFLAALSASLAVNRKKIKFEL
jgi:hypothetical protein